MNLEQSVLSVTGNKWVKYAIGALLIVFVCLVVKHVSESVAE